MARPIHHFYGNLNEPDVKPSLSALTPTWHSTIGLLGVAAILASFAYPFFADASHGWTEEKASQMQAAESIIHEQAGHGHEMERGRRPRANAAHAEGAESEVLQQARAYRRQLRAEFEAAVQRSEWTPAILFWGGLSLAAGSLLGSRLLAGH